MKIGTECEGRNQGIKTLFCSVEEFNTLVPVSLLEDGQDFRHIYISDHNNELEIKLEKCNAMLHMLSSYFQITVERTEVPKDITPDIEIMLFIDNESFWNLRDSDQFKFSKDLTVYADMKQNLVKTIPSDFDGDRIL